MPTVILETLADDPATDPDVLATVVATVGANRPIRRALAGNPAVPRDVRIALVRRAPQWSETFSAAVDCQDESFSPAEVLTMLGLDLQLSPIEVYSRLTSALKTYPDPSGQFARASLDVPVPPDLLHPALTCPRTPLADIVDRVRASDVTMRTQPADRIALQRRVVAEAAEARAPQQVAMARSLQCALRDTDDELLTSSMVALGDVLDDPAPMSLAWLRHPQRTAEQVEEAALGRDGDSTAWRRALFTVKDPAGTMARTALALFPRNAEIASAVLGGQAPVKYRQRAYRYLTGGGSQASLMDTRRLVLDSDPTWAVAAACTPEAPTELTEVLLARADLNAEELLDVADRLQQESATPRTMTSAVQLATHPNADPQVRAQARQLLLGSGARRGAASQRRTQSLHQTAGLLDALTSDGASQPTATTILRAPMPAFRWAPAGVSPLLRELTRDALRSADLRGPGAGVALGALTPTFTGTLSELLDAARAVAA